MSTVLTELAVHAALGRYAVERLRLDPALVARDLCFEEMAVDSLTRLELLLHADDTFGSHVLDALEAGDATQPPPTRLSELAAWVLRCQALSARAGEVA
jgi:hypothetical protein